MMSKGKGGSRPAGGRPPGRRGGGGSGPTKGGGGGTTGHKGGGPKGGMSSGVVGPVRGLVYAVAALAVLFVGTPVAIVAYRLVTL